MKKYVYLSLCIICTAVAFLFFMKIFEGEITFNNGLYCVLFAIAAVVTSHLFSEARNENIPKIS